MTINRKTKMELNSFVVQGLELSRLKLKKKFDFQHRVANCRGLFGSGSCLGGVGAEFGLTLNF